ncbi:MAG: 2-isopropylmalate synthase [Candidatus Ancaeobacter aquaticus]|nr:2-isopropylmalate synthase [Candidatus Ancaeobacter aquaticus]
MKEKVIIFDTTLRDGEQSPGASMDLREKLEVARQLERMNVDVIEAGFPIASPGDYEAVKLVSKELKKPIICGLARSVKKDIDRALDALKYAKHPRIHIFLATSKIHMKHKLKKAESEILKIATESVAYARKYIKDIEFSPEDASRTEPEFLKQVVEAVIGAGATTVNIPDTVGYTLPCPYGEQIKYLKENVSNIEKAVISVHCHNDLGLAVANSISAIVNGARQIECTINGIGERAGNAAMEEIVMILKTRKDLFRGLYTDINAKEIYRSSKLVSQITGIHVQPNKAIVGENAFAHESGIHQDGMLKERTTYEIMRPESIGLTESKLVLGKHSGRHAFKNKLESMGLSLKQDDLDKAFERFKTLADKKKTIYDEDIQAIISDEIAHGKETYQLEYLNVTSGTGSIPTATVKVRKGSKVLTDAACGDGPVDAACKTIDRITGITGKLTNYSLRAVTSGKDAIGEVFVRVDSEGKTVSGRGANTDIIVASAKAYLNAINHLIYMKTEKKAISGKV